MATIAVRRLAMYPRGESNPNRRNRNPKFYPLNYGDIDKGLNPCLHCKVNSFASILQKKLFQSRAARRRCQGISGRRIYEPMRRQNTNPASGMATPAME